MEYKVHDGFLIEVENSMENTIGDFVHFTSTLSGLDSQLEGAIQKNDLGLQKDLQNQIDLLTFQFNNLKELSNG